MCVIAIATKTDPNLQTLYKCQQANPHGGGVAWAENGYVHFKKGINAEEMQDLVAKKPFPHIFHFRIASVGKVIPALCHPFVVKRKHNCDLTGVTQNPVFFHNGTVSDWKYMALLAGVKYPDFASDSMVLARIISLRGEGILPAISSGNRFVVLRPDGTFKTFGHFEKVDGCEYSNNYWNYRTASNSYYSGGNQCSLQDDLNIKTPSVGDGKIQCPTCKRYNVESDGAGSFLCHDCFNFWEHADATPEPIESDDEDGAEEGVGDGFRKLKPSEILTGADEVKAPDGWHAVAAAFLGNPAGSAHIFRRKVELTPPAKPISLGEGWRQVLPDEVVEAGDEWNTKDLTNIWQVTSIVGQRLGISPNIYRRRVDQPPVVKIPVTDGGAK